MRARNDKSVGECEKRDSNWWRDRGKATLCSRPSSVSTQSNYGSLVGLCASAGGMKQEGSEPRDLVKCHGQNGRAFWGGEAGFGGAGDKFLKSARNGLVC